ncbi:MAG: DUF4105 domain-containing protein [Deltaproteobacteria bacterium]|nr:MAG: DUF4105 domain-containing protein [Deltaproteobacteria bacterium]
MPNPVASRRTVACTARGALSALALLVVLTGPAWGAERVEEARALHCSSECERILELIDSRRLWEHPGWQRLMHVRARRIGAPVSEAIGRGFFVHPSGRRDLRAELRATVIAFFSPEDISVPESAPTGRRDRHIEGALAPPEVDHPGCRFPARQGWLLDVLGEDTPPWPERECPSYEAFREQLQPRGVALVFSSYYLNNPASAFGHTFLRIVRTDEDMAEDRRALLDYAIDYAANVDTPNAILYAFRGLTGLFPGTFSIYPYYYKVRQYNDLEFRDLFEYELALTEAQRERLVEHLWELGHTYFRYFYTSRNCSHRILAALEVAVPDAELLAHVRSPVIPGETIKALYRNEGLVRQVVWRPSLRAQFEARTQDFDRSERRLARRLSRDAAAEFPADLAPDRQAMVLDAAIDLVDMAHLEELVLGTDAEAAERKQQLMVRRARTRQPPSVLALREPLEERPERSHHGGRLSAGVAMDVDARQPSVVLEHRTVLHDLADPPMGYPDVLSMELIRTRLRYTPEVDRLRVDHFRFADIRSITPVDAFNAHLAWQLGAGMHRPVDRGCADCAVLDLSLAGGFALGALDRRLLFWAMSRTVVEASAALDGPWGGPVRLGVGPWGGVRLRLGPRAAFYAEGGGLWFPGDAAELTPRAQSALRVGLLRNLAIGVEGRLDQRLVEGAGLLYVYY